MWTCTCISVFVECAFFQASIKQSIMNRFKEFCRTPKVYKVESKSKSLPRSETKSKQPGSDWLLKSHIIPPGEDETSFKGHNKLLMMESRTSNPNMAVVSSLMARSFALRRSDILKKSCDITTIFSKYPFLRNIEQVSNNFNK